MIYVCGDIHGNWPMLNKFIDKKKPEIILQCGDFGFWPHYHNSTKFDGTGKPWNQYGIKNKGTKIFWCDGNHENHDEIDLLSEKYGFDDPIELEKFNNVFYMPRTSILEINDLKIMFIGGAYSIDKEHRIIGNSWWHQEQISRKDIDNLKDEKIDIIISHTIPQQFFHLLGKSQTFNDSERWLDYVFDAYRPKKWYFGHFHLYKKFHKRDCEFTCLDECCGMKWYEKLDI